MRTQPLRRAQWPAGTARACVSLLLAAAGCNTNTPDPSSGGVLQVRVETVGADLDLDGYEVTVDGIRHETVRFEGTVVIYGLSTGSHHVALTGIAENCTVSGLHPRPVTVNQDERSEVTFVVGCRGTGVEVTNTTTGLDLDPNGYLVQVDGAGAWELAINGTTSITHLGAGSHTVALSAVADNCIVGAPNPRAVTVTAGETVPVPFVVSCVATTGSIEVTATTSGEDLDLNNYTVQVDGGPVLALAPNRTTTIAGVAPGDHSVRLGGVPGNCAVIGQNPRTVAVTLGDTARTTFEVSCAAVQKIAFTAGGYEIAVAYADGSNVVSLAQGSGPAWSPDGTRIVFTATECDYYYGCYPSGLFVINADRSGFVRLTDRSNDFAPAWSPDGSMIAFASSRTEPAQVYLMNADGSGIVRVTSTVGGAVDPDWSPNGTLIAFTCRVASDNVDICTVKPDGTGLVRLTSDAAEDRNPTWKPDGSKIAFVTNRYGAAELVVMNADGSGLTRILPGTGVSDPAWSPDGTKIAFAQISCDYYYGCYSSGLFVINADGTGLKRLTTGTDTTPAWRP